MSLSEVGLLLLVAALIAAILNVLNSIVQVIRRQEARAGWISALLSLTTVVATAGALVIQTFFAPLPVSPLALLFITGLALLLVGVFLYLLIERRREAFAPEFSFGLLLAGIGFLTGVMVIFIPLMPAEFWPPPPPTMTATATGTATATATPTSRFSPTPTVTPTASLTATLTPSPTATPTRQRYSTRTPTPTMTVEASCTAYVNYNLNLRALPSTESEAIDLIPYETVIEVAGPNEAGDWWFVAYNGRWGWVDGQYIALDNSCEAAPVIPD